MSSAGDAPVRVHLAPVFDGPGPQKERDWLVDEYGRSASQRYRLEADPRRADLILLTDSGAVSSHIRFRRETLDLLTHPLVRRYRSRCLLYYDHDVPRVYLPGLYRELEWQSGVASWGVSGPYLRRLEEGNPYFDDGVAGSERDFLTSFLGRHSHVVRARLFALEVARDDVLIRDTTKLYDHFSGDRDPDGRKEYADVMRRSRWALCPRGWSVGSLRIYEAMKVGVAPVIVSDRWLPPEGLPEERFALWIPEARLAELPEILESNGERWRAMGAAAREAYETHLAPGRSFEFLLDRAMELLERRGQTSTPGTLLAQGAELAAHLTGWTSPPLAWSRFRGSLPPTWSPPAGPSEDT